MWKLPILGVARIVLYEGFFLLFFLRTWNQNFSFAFARENSPVQPLFVKDPRITGVLFHCVSNSACCQGKVLVFIGDWRATKEPIPVCLATTKSWDWHTGDAITDFTKCNEYYAVEANKGTLWTPAAGDGALAKIKVPNLVAIPNALVSLLRQRGLAHMPQDVLATINKFIQNNGQPAAGQCWECVQKWGNWWQWWGRGSGQPALGRGPPALGRWWLCIGSCASAGLLQLAGWGGPGIGSGVLTGC